MDSQLNQLLTVLDANDIQETKDRIYFKIGQRQQELYKGFPLVVVIETSSWCNLKCLGCPYKKLTRPHQFMEFDLFKKIVNEVLQYKVRTWFHFMGDPLMHPQIFEFIDYATKQGLPYFGMSSNGLVLTKDVAEKILDSKMHRLEISLDSLDPELSGKLRPGGNPKVIIKNIHNYFEMKYRRNLKYPISSIAIRELKQNAHEIEKFIAYWNNIIKEPDFVMSIRYVTWGGHESQEHSTWTAPEKNLPCLKLWHTLIILTDGRVVTCDGNWDAQLVMGDVKTNSISEIWNSNEYNEARQKHLTGRAKEVIICSNCIDWYREIGPHQYTNWTYKTKNWTFE